MLVSKKELINQKLKSIKVEDLKELAESLGESVAGNGSDIIKRIIDKSSEDIDEFIKRKYQTI